jgi:hypothetical protein
MSKTSAIITIDTVFDRVFPLALLAQNWSILLRTKKWQNRLLVLWSEEEGNDWRPNGKVDYVCCAIGGDKC